jgi:hypothetical protein
MGTYSKLVQTSPAPDKEAEPESVSIPEKTPDPNMHSTEKQEVESIHASMQANKLASKLASKHVDLHDHMLTLLEEKATYGYTFRYPPQLLEMLEDLLPTIRQRHQVKLTKNAIAVAAIVFLLSDYETFGEESVLYQLLIEPYTE